MKNIYTTVLNLLLLASVLLTGHHVRAQVWNQLGSDIDGEAGGDQSANSISLNADATVIAIGAERNSGTAGANSDMGHVRVYAWSGTAWVQRGTDIDGEAAGDHAGISVDLSADGNTLVVGAFGNDQAAINAGHARVFVWNGTNWQQKGLSINGENAYDNFGTSVNLSANGNIVAIGTPVTGGSSASPGYVNIYEWSGTAWVQLGATIDGEASDDESGSAIDLSANGYTIAIGAPSNDGNGTDSGHTRVYEWNGTTWIQKGLDIDGETAFDFSGRSVSLSANGNILAVGSSKNDGASGNIDIGQVRVYEWNGTTWVQLGLDIEGESTGDLSGCSVSLDSLGNTIAIGAYKNDGNGSNSGHTRVYDWNGSTWLQKGMDIDGESSDNYSGYAVSLGNDGNSLAIGAIRNDGNGTYSGHARIYRSCAPTTGTDVITACESYNWIDGNTYTSSNTTATHTLTNATGCDSVVTLNLTINNSSTGTDVITTCDSYNWIDGNTYTSSNNTATHTLTNAAGCDSVVTLNLTINTVDISITSTDPTLTANATSANYQWLDCDDDFAPILGEINSSFSPSENGNYAVEVTQNGCVDTSACEAILTVNLHPISYSTAKVYPNPANEQFIIDFGSKLPLVDVEILSVSGRIVAEHRYENEEKVLVHIEEPAGIYLIKIETSEGKQIVRLIIE